MSDGQAELPEPHRVISMTRFDDPVSVISDTEAWRARDTYPDIMGRGPMFALVEQEADGRWRVLLADEGNPQGCRDELARECRLRAADAVAVKDREAQRLWLTGARRMDWEKLNELKVGEHRFRIARGDMFIRMGPDGPEPPRPSDPDPMRPGEGHRARPRTRGFLIDPAAATGMSEGMLRIDLLSFVYPSSRVPHDVRADSLRALQSHPGGVLLPPVFAITEFTEGRWTPMTGGADTPQEIRDTLVTYLRDVAPAVYAEDAVPAAHFRAAAKALAGTRRDEVRCADRHYRVMRLERLIRVGPDGPESPRASDWDPELPVEAQAERDRLNGVRYGAN
ncbi:DUF5954 family protein [Streptomyces sp. XC 2026]|uniref:DUF5954 family protein n=1 Tax=Streptomyces sp. XC 2026 TaxID=2782004 RepID=UPI001903BBED|nr:DUF5954 family protein [Streptomyces sp. XC 2026]QQN80058.1 hypothetical protein IPZ77_23545 [Streptomyces sp. XC 2026]